MGRVMSERSSIRGYPAPDNPSLQLYDRYVFDGRMCSPSQRAVTKSVPAADTARCAVRKCQRVSGGRSR